jgi:hypothetical protein
MFKLIILPQTRTGMDRAGLRQHLEQVHGPLVMAHPEASDVFRSYVHHYALDEGPVPFGTSLLAGRDAVTIIRFDSPADITRSKGSAAYREVIGPDEDNFRDLAGSVALRAAEDIIAPDAPEAVRKVFLLAGQGSLEAGESRQRLAAIARLPGLCGLTHNAVEVLEGAWPFPVIDELSLLPGADQQAIADALRDAGLLAGASVLITQPVTFRALQGAA